MVSTYIYQYWAAYLLSYHQNSGPTLYTKLIFNYLQDNYRKTLSDKYLLQNRLLLLLFRNTDRE